MKKDIDRLYIALVAIVALFLAFSCNAQGYRPRIAPIVLSFASGAAWAGVATGPARRARRLLAVVAGLLGVVADAPAAGEG